MLIDQANRGEMRLGCVNIPPTENGSFEVTFPLISFGFGARKSLLLDFPPDFCVGRLARAVGHFDSCQRCFLLTHRYRSTNPGLALP